MTQSCLMLFLVFFFASCAQASDVTHAIPKIAVPVSTSVPRPSIHPSSETEEDSASMSCLLWHGEQEGKQARYYAVQDSSTVEDIYGRRIYPREAGFVPEMLFLIGITKTGTLNGLSGWYLTCCHQVVIKTWFQDEPPLPEIRTYFLDRRIQTETNRSP